MAQNHTPGPWSVFGRCILGAGSTDTYDGVVMGTIAVASELEDSDGDGRNWSAGGSPEANAAFIVRACNAHDELVAALKATAGALQSSASERDRIKFTGQWANLGLRTIGSILDDAQAALAKAEAA